MRAIGLLILLGLGRTASACPVEGLCVRAPALESRHATFGAGREVALAPVRTRSVATDVEMPWIWQVLRTKVVQRLPRYEQGGGFAMHLSPVVVSTVDTVPGVGVEGRF